MYKNKFLSSMFFKKILNRLPYVLLLIVISSSGGWMWLLLPISNAPLLFSAGYGYSIVEVLVVLLSILSLLYLYRREKYNLCRLINAFLFQCICMMFVFVVLCFVSSFKCALILCTYGLLFAFIYLFLATFMCKSNVLLAVLNNDMFTLKILRYTKPFFASFKYKDGLELIFPLIYALEVNASCDLIRYLIRLSPGAVLDLVPGGWAERRLLQLITEDKCLLNMVIKKSKDFFAIKRRVLHLVMNARLDLIKVIIENANIEDNAYRKDLLKVSALRGDSDIFLYLFENFSSSLSDSDYDELYETAARAGNPKIVDTIRSKGKSYDFDELLRISSENGHRDLCEYLLEESGAIALKEKVGSLGVVHDEVGFLFSDLGLRINRPGYNYNPRCFENKTLIILLNLFSKCRNGMICYLSDILGSEDLSKLVEIVVFFSARYPNYMPVMQRNLLYMFEYFNKDVIDKIKNKFQVYVNEKKYDEAYCYLIKQAATNIKACGSANFRNYLEPLECTTGLPSDLSTIVLEYKGTVLERC